MVRTQGMAKEGKEELKKVLSVDKRGQVGLKRSISKTKRRPKIK